VVQAAANGWHTLRLTSVNLPSQGYPFDLTVTYTATQGIPG
jgi:hypothetical protein